jgi:hypothetical protein
VRDIAHRFRGDGHTVDDLLSSENDLGRDSKSIRLLKAEDARDDRLARENDEHNARTLEDQPEIGEEPGDSKGEATCRKVLRRAAECLQAGLQVDGIMFSDGLAGFYGSV